MSVSIAKNIEKTSMISLSDGTINPVTIEITKNINISSMRDNVPRQSQHD